jgi:hypothetical protein
MDKELNEEELNLLCSYLLRLYKTTSIVPIKRVAKSLFNLLTENRFSTIDKPLPIIKIK